MILNIREATRADQNGIKKMIYSVLEEYGLSPDPASTDRDLEDIEKYYTKNAGYFGVLEEENTIVASSGILRIDDCSCELRKMYMLANQRGKGLGKKLLEFSLEKAKTLGYSHVTLETASPLREAIGLYKKFGFKEYSPKHLSNRCDKAFEFYFNQ